MKVCVIRSVDPIWMKPESITKADCFGVIWTLSETKQRFSEATQSFGLLLKPWVCLGDLKDGKGIECLSTVSLSCYSAQILLSTFVRMRTHLSLLHCICSNSYLTLIELLVLANV